MSMDTLTQPKVETLNALHRCDADCPARARVRCTGELGSELLFCGHHYAKHETALLAWAVDVLDERFFDEKSESGEDHA